MVFVSTFWVVDDIKSSGGLKVIHVNACKFMYLNRYDKKIVSPVFTKHKYCDTFRVCSRQGGCFCIFL